jgi:hypothetical protein
VPGGWKNFMSDGVHGGSGTCGDVTECWKSFRFVSRFWVGRKAAEMSKLQMLLQKICAIFYISGEFLHFGLT